MGLCGSEIGMQIWNLGEGEVLRSMEKDGKEIKV